LTRAVENLRAGEIDAAAVESCAAYGLRRSEQDEVLSWWRATR
jgi:hypothetical protein